MAMHSQQSRPEHSQLIETEGRDLSQQDERLLLGYAWIALSSVPPGRRLQNTPGTGAVLSTECQYPHGCKRTFRITWHL